MNSLDFCFNFVSVECLQIDLISITLESLSNSFSFHVFERTVRFIEYFEIVLRPAILLFLI